MRAPREAQRLVVEPQATPAYVSFVWQDLAPGAIQFDAPLVHLETQHQDGRWVPLFIDTIPVNDQGLHIEIRYVRDLPLAGAGVWQTTWYPQTLVSGPLRFVIAARHQLSPLYSEPFRLLP